MRWSAQVLAETERAIETILTGKDYDSADAKDRAARARRAMETAFEEALVDDYEDLTCACDGMPDHNDIHVLAAALKTQAATIVTENLKDFPERVLAPLNIAVAASVSIAANLCRVPRGSRGSDSPINNSYNDGIVAAAEFALINLNLLKVENRHFTYEK